MTLFLEESPGSVSWEIEYNKTQTGEITTIQIPDDSPTAGILRNSYVAM